MPIYQELFEAAALQAARSDAGRPAEQPAGAVIAPPTRRRDRGAPRRKRRGVGKATLRPRAERRVVDQTIPHHA